jgi:hypothetical protein
MVKLIKPVPIGKMTTPKPGERKIKPTDRLMKPIAKKI